MIFTLVGLPIVLKLVHSGSWFSGPQKMTSISVAPIAGRAQVQEKLGAKVNGEFAQVAQIRAQLENAQWELDQTTTRSPCDCYVVNLQLRPVNSTVSVGSTISK